MFLCETLGGDQSATYVNKQGFIRLIQNTRKIVPQVFLDAFNIQEHRFVSKETDFVNRVQLAFPGVDWLPQYSVHPYRIDVYSEKHNLAIEFDEKYHNSPTQREVDVKREEDIRCMLKGVRILRVNECENVDVFIQKLEKSFGLKLKR